MELNTETPLVGSDKQLGDKYAEKRKLKLQRGTLVDDRAKRKREQDRANMARIHAADPHAYNRRRLLWNLNSRRIMAPRPATMMKYSISYNPETDTWS